MAGPVPAAAHVAHRNPAKNIFLGFCCARKSLVFPDKEFPQWRPYSRYSFRTRIFNSFS
jgi:hypothetical protein